MTTPTSDPTLRIDRLRPDMASAFQGLLRIYREAIPESERKSDGALRGMLERADYELLIATRGGAVAGFSIVECFPEPDGCLLEYMAVDRTIRSQGIGSALFRAACSS